MTVKRGRRPRAIDIAALIRALAAGASVKSAARAVGLSARSLHRRAAQDPQLRKVIDQGQAHCVEAVALRVRGRALAGSVTAARLMLHGQQVDDGFDEFIAQARAARGSPAGGR